MIIDLRTMETVFEGTEEKLTSWMFESGVIARQEEHFYLMVICND